MRRRLGLWLVCFRRHGFLAPLGCGDFRKSELLELNVRRFALEGWLLNRLQNIQAVPLGRIFASREERRMSDENHRVLGS